jgi:hypothetical protein
MKLLKGEEGGDGRGVDEVGGVVGDDCEDVDIHPQGKNLQSLLVEHTR